MSRKELLFLVITVLAIALDTHGLSIQRAWEGANATEGSSLACCTGGNCYRKTCCKGYYKPGLAPRWCNKIRRSSLLEADQQEATATQEVSDESVAGGDAAMVAEQRACCTGGNCYRKTCCKGYYRPGLAPRWCNKIRRSSLLEADQQEATATQEVSDESVVGGDAAMVSEQRACCTGGNCYRKKCCKGYYKPSLAPRWCNKVR